MNFSLEDREIDAETHLIELRGEVDLYTAPQLRERMATLIDEGRRRLVVDLTGVTFIDSTTLGVLVGANKRLQPVDGSLSLVCSDPHILKIFEITGLVRVFPIHESREQAVQALATSGTP